MANLQVTLLNLFKCGAVASHYIVRIIKRWYVCCADYKQFKFKLHFWLSHFCHKITEFVVQVGYKIDDERTHNARILTLVTSAGSVVEIKRKKKGNERKGSPLCFTSTSVAIKWLNYPCSSHEVPIERRSYSTAVSTESKLQGLTWQTRREVRRIDVWCSRLSLL